MVEEGSRCLVLKQTGILLRDLQKQVAPTAELVGSDVTATFLPEAPDGNIRYTVGDICSPPSEDLAGHFDLTHVRLVLPFTGKVGPEKAVANMAGTLRHFYLFRCRSVVDILLQRLWLPAVGCKTPRSTILPPKRTGLLSTPHCA